MAVLLKRWIREPLNTAAMYFRWSIIFRLAPEASRVAGRVGWPLYCPLLGMLCAYLLSLSAGDARTSGASEAFSSALFGLHSFAHLKP